MDALERNQAQKLIAQAIAARDAQDRLAALPDVPAVRDDFGAAFLILVGRLDLAIKRIDAIDASQAQVKAMLTLLSERQSLCDCRHGPPVHTPAPAPVPPPGPSIDTGVPSEDARRATSERVEAFSRIAVAYRRKLDANDGPPDGTLSWAEWLDKLAGTQRTARHNLTLSDSGPWPVLRKLLTGSTGHSDAETMGKFGRLLCSQYSGQGYPADVPGYYLLLWRALTPDELATAYRAATTTRGSTSEASA